MSHKITVQTNLLAPVSKVWQAYTKPEHIVNWNFADPSWECPSAENDLRTGGKFRFKMQPKNGEEGFYFEGEYTEVVPSELIKYTFGGREAEIKFQENGESTNVIVSFDPENENPEEMQQAGWQSILDNFKSYTEKL